MKKGVFSLPTSFRIFYMWLIGFCFLYFSLVTGTHADDECPLQLNPQRVVVKYNGSVSVDCSAYVPHRGMGWEVSEGPVPMTRENLTTWRVPKLREWGIEPGCYINHNKTQCTVNLPVTIYKTPDSVSISTVNHNGPMMEGNQYELQCDVLNVAPVQNLTVNWYKGQTLVNQTIFTDTIKTPVNKTSKLLIRPDRADDGAQYRCEAKLELGEEGPQPPPTAPSEHLSITVYYGPIINAAKLPSIVPVFRGYPVVIVCEAEGNPKPAISWSVNSTGETLTITESTPEDLHCIANSSAGSTIRSIKVSIQDISISTGKHTGPMIVGEEYELQCDWTLHTVAKSVVVRLYRGEHVVNETIITDSSNSSYRKSYKFKIHPKKTDVGAQYCCEAQLELGEGPQPPPKVTSESLNIIVHYGPIINETKLLSKVPVFRGYPLVIVCEAEGNPEPRISWSVNSTGETLTITESTPEDLLCIASNYVGNTTRRVKVVLKEDYLPLIAGLVAITVAFISVIFIFIYSIYYKTAKMGRYNLKDAKLSPQNGDIAQNGKDNSIPMKKLSQSNILA
ncbi:unnamed protein product [Leuciscus chuanchicus]